jgi:hypothetical protein
MKAIFDRYEGLVKLCSVPVTATKFKVKINTVFDPAPKFLRDAGVNHVRTFSPLELVVTAVLVACQMDYRTDEQLLDDVKAMRTYLRVEHKDLRVNAQCWSTSWYYITEIMDRRRGIKPAAGLSVSSSISGLRQSIEVGSNQLTGRSLDADATTSQELSDRDSSPLSSAPSSLSDEDESSSTSNSSSDNVDAHARLRQRRLGKKRAPAEKSIAKNTSKRSRRFENKSNKARPAKMARIASSEIRFDSL